MMKLQARLQDKLGKRRELGMLRQLRPNSGGVDFCSNDYLGLSRNTTLRELQRAPQHRAAPGSTGSRLISGNSGEHQQLEAQLANWLGFESTLLMSTGYAANTGLISCLGERGDTLICDRLIHASLIDGARLSHAKRLIFRHNDLDNLREKLEFPCAGQRFVVIESVYSMDGDLAPLQQIVELCEEFDAALIVDEAHSIGLFGSEGEGLVAQLGLQARVAACVFTFGKASGCHGAAIASNRTLHDYLLNYCRPFIYSTAPAPDQVATISAHCAYLRDADEERARLQTLISYFKRHMRSRLSEAVSANDSPIQFLLIPGMQRCKDIAEQLRERGFNVYGITAPTVPEGTERLRICLHSDNDREQIDALGSALYELLAAHEAQRPCA